MKFRPHIVAQVWFFPLGLILIGLGLFSSDFLFNWYTVSGIFLYFLVGMFFFIELRYVSGILFNEKQLIIQNGYLKKYAFSVDSIREIKRIPYLRNVPDGIQALKIETNEETPPDSVINEFIYSEESLKELLGMILKENPGIKLDPYYQNLLISK